MNKELFIRVVDELENENYVAEISSVTNYSIDDIVDKIFSLQDAEILDILLTSRKELKIAKFYLYLKQNYLSHDLKETLEKNIKNLNPNSYYVLKLIEVINSNTKYNNSLNRVDLLNMVNSIVNSKSEVIANCASLVAVNSDVSKKENALDFVNVILNVEHDYQALYAFLTSVDKQILDRDDSLKIVTTISEAKKEFQAEYARKLLLSNEVKKQENVLDLVQTVLKEENVLNANSFVTKTIKTLKQGNEVSVSDDFEEKEVSRLVKNYFKNKYMLDSGDFKELMEIINSVHGDNINFNTKVKVKKYNNCNK